MAIIKGGSQYLSIQSVLLQLYDKCAIIIESDYCCKMVWRGRLVELKSMDLFDSVPKNENMHNDFIVLDNMKVREFVEGSEDKFFIVCAGKRFLVKDSSFNKRRKQESLAPYCEYVGSNFIRLSGLLPCQKTYLGWYKERPVVICEDLFTEQIFRPFKELHQSSAGTDLGNKEYTYEDVLYVLQQKERLVSSDFSDFKSRFWLMFLFDAILGNRDRHEGNWGFIKSNGKTQLAPIFDNGSSLFPDVDLSDWKHPEFLKDRVFKLPVSQFKMWKPGILDRPMRTNFYEIIRDFHYEFEDELTVVRNLPFKKLLEQSIVGVPEEVAAWFRCIVECRFRTLILGEDFDSVWRYVQHDLY